MFYHFRNAFRLVRGFNLIMIVLCMAFFQYFMIFPVMDSIRLYPSLDALHFSLLTFGVVCIAAAGYVVNDYFDFEIDREYKNERNVIGSWISLEQAYYLQFALNLTGIALCYYVGWYVGNFKLGNLSVFCAALLWIYSMFLKKYFLIGNIVIAALSGFVFVLLVLYEQHLFFPYPVDGSERALANILLQMKGYAFFAFWVSLTREIIKDAEDMQGDMAANMNTLPIVLPTVYTNLVIAGMLLVLMIAIGFLEYIYWQGGAMKHFWYTILTIQFIASSNFFTVFNSKEKQDYHNISVFMKLIMLFGIFTLPLFELFNRYGG